MPAVEIPGIGVFNDNEERDFPGEQWSRPMVGVFYENAPETVWAANSIQDMADEEIQALADMDMFTGKPIRYDHQGGTDCGVIDKVWRDGRKWMVQFRLDQSTPLGRLMTGRVRSGLARGLSLHHEYHSRRPLEISVCPVGARPGTTVIQASNHQAVAEELQFNARLNRAFRMCVEALQKVSIAASAMDGQGSYNGPRKRVNQREAEPVTVEAPVSQEQWENEKMLMLNQLRQAHGVPHPHDQVHSESYEEKKRRYFEQAQEQVLREKAALQQQRTPFQQGPLPPQQYQPPFQQAPLPPQQQAPLPPQQPSFNAPPSLSEVNIKFPDGFTREQKLKFLEQNWELATATNPALSEQRRLLERGITPATGPRVVLGDDIKDTEMEKEKEKEPSKEKDKTVEILKKRVDELEAQESKRNFEMAFERFINIRGRDAGTGDSLERLRKSYEAQWNSGEAGQKAFLELVANEETVVGRKRGRRGREEADESSEEDPRSRTSKSTPAASSEASETTGKIDYKDYMKLAEAVHGQKLANMAPTPPAPPPSAPISVAASGRQQDSAFQRRIESVMASNPTLQPSPQALNTLQMLQEHPEHQRLLETQNLFMVGRRDGRVDFRTPSSFAENGGKGLWQETATVPEYVRFRYSDMYDGKGNARSGY